jgi:acetyltransferase-like isoleucine patch superfamily enzyme
MRFKFKNIIKSKGLLPFIKSLFIYCIKLFLGRINLLIYFPYIKGSKKKFKIFGKCSIMYPKQITIGNDVYIGNNTVFISECQSGKLIIGSNVKINDNCLIDHSGNLLIKDECFISSNVIIYTHDHGYDPRSKPEFNKLTIGKNVWVGRNVVIMPKCKSIGDNSIISLGAIVTKNIPKNSIYFSKNKIVKKVIE